MGAARGPGRYGGKLRPPSRLGAVSSPAGVVNLAMPHRGVSQGTSTVRPTAGGGRRLVLRANRHAQCSCPWGSGQHRGGLAEGRFPDLQYEAAASIGTAIGQPWLTILWCSDAPNRSGAAMSLLIPCGLKGLRLWLVLMALVPAIAVTVLAAGGAAWAVRASFGEQSSQTLARAMDRAERELSKTARRMHGYAPGVDSRSDLVTAVSAGDVARASNPLDAGGLGRRTWSERVGPGGAHCGRRDSARVRHPS